MKNQVIADLTVIRAHEHHTPQAFEEAMVSLETFVAIAINVFGDINTSKLIEHMRIVELRQYIPRENKDAT